MGIVALLVLRAAVTCTTLSHHRASPGLPPSRVVNKECWHRYCAGCYSRQVLLQQEWLNRQAAVSRTVAWSTSQGTSILKQSLL